MEKKLSKQYYSTDGYWKGMAAIKQLMDATGAPESIAEPWIRKQILWQLYLPKPKYIPHPHYQITKPDAVHQADLLFLPYDKVGNKIYKYALVVIDIASRYKDAEALESKNSTELAGKFEKIYSRRLDWPGVLMVDPGREFMGEVTRLMTKHETKIKRSDAGNHRAQAFVERANRTLGEKIFSHQSAQELVTGGVSKEWVWRLPGLIKNMNHRKTRIINDEPADALAMKEIRQYEPEFRRKIGANEDLIPPEAHLRYLLLDGENQIGDKRRATDFVWSLEIYEIRRSVVSHEQPVLYYLNNIILKNSTPKRGFVREELQIVPAGSELPPGHIFK